MTKVITIKEANISTLNVELKAIHINAKQMTLSVFRQIQEENIWTEDFKLNGIPWGTVNYFWDKAQQFNDTVLHVVWQKENELRRFRCTDIVKGSRYEQLNHAEYTIKERYFGELEYRLQQINGFFEGKEYYNLQRKDQYDRIDNIRIYRPEKYEKNGIFDHHYTQDQLNEKWYLNAYNNRKEEYEKAQWFAAKDKAEKVNLEKLIPQKKSEALAYIEKWRKSYQQLAQLPQLYIAA